MFTRAISVFSTHAAKNLMIRCLKYRMNQDQNQMRQNVAKNGRQQRSLGCVINRHREAVQSRCRILAACSVTQSRTSIALGAANSKTSRVILLLHAPRSQNTRWRLQINIFEHFNPIDTTNNHIWHLLYQPCSTPIPPPSTTISPDPAPGAVQHL